MVIDYQKAKAVFLEAVHHVPASEWSAHLDRACDGEPELRRQVEKLLAAHQSQGDVATHAVQSVAEKVMSGHSECVGTQIGPYKLLEQIGEGGMGVVYVAEQTEPVRRRVALKVIKPGMDSKQVIARFEAERQALAMMDHPNIAKVLDAGTVGQVASASDWWLEKEQTDQTSPALATSASHSAGRPYFVMELVRGLSITEYCDKARLNPRKRLELFVTVCQAVQHAHQKGIIHRDLKPSNVMVTLHDGTPVVKVIDFGVAKAMGQQLTERTIYTAHTQLVGTPLYMSPEQAELSGLDVDTRSDVYSLGVLLYELLTGQTPFDKETLSKAGFDEMRRMIREDEPPRPSQRISTLNAQASSTISQSRSLDDRQLTRLLRGELDWIVMKSLEKERNRRYESASALAADVQRYLSDEPVQACPPSAVYRFQKFARKNRAALITAFLVATSLLLGTGVSLWQAIRATSAEAQATANEVNAKSEGQKATALAQSEAAQRKLAEKNFDAALEALDRMLRSIYTQEFRDIPRMGPPIRRVLNDAAAFCQQITAPNSLPKETRVRLGQTWILINHHTRLYDEPQQAMSARDNAVAIAEQLVAENPGEPLYLAMAAYFEMEKPYPDSVVAEKAHRRAAELFTKLAEIEPAERTWPIMVASSLLEHAHDIGLQGKPDEAISDASRMLDLVEPKDPSNGFLRGRILLEIGHWKSQTAPGQQDDILRRALAEFERYFTDPEAPKRYITQPHPYGFRSGTWEGVHRPYGNALRSIAQTLSPRHPLEAEQLFDQAIEEWRTIVTPTHTRRIDYDALAGALTEKARHLRNLAADPPAGDDPTNAAQRRKKAEELVREAIKTQRVAAERFGVAESKWSIVRLLQEESQYILGGLNESQPTDQDDVGSRKHQADALLTEAIQLCRDLVAEFPDNANYNDRLTALLKFQNERSGRKEPTQDSASKQ